VHVRAIVKFVRFAWKWVVVIVSTHALFELMVNLVDGAVWISRWSEQWLTQKCCNWSDLEYHRWEFDPLSIRRVFIVQNVVCFTWT
jgi:hypothetical protein